MLGHGAISQRAISSVFQPKAAGAGAPIISHGGLHHISEGMGDVGDGPRVPQTLHTIEQGVTTP
jgi:hypothetical protein